MLQKIVVKDNNSHDFDVCSVNQQDKNEKEAVQSWYFGILHQMTWAQEKEETLVLYKKPPPQLFPFVTYSYLCF